MTDTLQRTALYTAHVADGGRMVPFAGWEMPIQYEGILAEARAVRNSSGIFDVSHMGRLYIKGPGAEDLLDWVVTNDVRALSLGRARYTLVCTEQGGILDDGIYYRLGEDRFLLVANAANRLAVWQWLQRWASTFGEVTLDDQTVQTVMIAFQGPQAAPILSRLADGVDTLRPFAYCETNIRDIPAVVVRTGYTGEDGFEIIADKKHGISLWALLHREGASLCGLGSRDILRLEAALLLHGTDMDTSVNPLEAGLGRFVKLEKESVASKALTSLQEAGLSRKMVGFQMVAKGIPRHGYGIVDVEGNSVGHVTSGAYSPTLDIPIGLGYVTVGSSAPGTRVFIDIRGRSTEAEIVSLPFYSRRRS